MIQTQREKVPHDVGVQCGRSRLIIPTTRRHRLSNLAVGSDNAEQRDDPDEVEAKLQLIEFSYREVLDATKHQDDKIGRMLTSVAFLTAAAMALAALSSAQFLTRNFKVPPFTL